MKLIITQNSIIVNADKIITIYPSERGSEDGTYYTIMASLMNCETIRLAKYSNEKMRDDSLYALTIWLTSPSDDEYYKFQHE